MHSYKRNLQEFLRCKVDRVSSWCSEGCRFKPCGEPETSSFSHARDELFITFFTLIVFVLKERKLTQSYFYLSICYNRRPCMSCRFPNKLQATWRSHHHFAPKKQGFFTLVVIILYWSIKRKMPVHLIQHRRKRFYFENIHIPGHFKK